MVCSEVIVSQAGSSEESNTDFLLVSILRQTLLCFKIECFILFGNKVCPIQSSRCSFLGLSFWAPFWEESMLGIGLIMHRELNRCWLCRALCLNPASPAFHVAQLLTQVELCLKLQHSFTYLLWKGLRRGWENEFGMECGGKLKASAATVLYFLSFSETRAMYN